MKLKPDTLLNQRYHIVRQLGQGGMGAVYLALDTALDHPVAVKMNRSPTANGSAQFLREARLLASLRHPNLPRVTDYFMLDENEYLVMDYIPGDDLSSRLDKEGTQPLEKVLRWAQQLGSALSYLHNQHPPIIHRDIKPANLKLTLDEEVILVDFGIAKTADPNQATAAGAVGYTPGFAPPEQYGGAHTAPYSDQYSLAATLYTLLTGQKPADSVQRLLGKVTLAPIHTLNPAVPIHVDNAIQRALSVQPEQRFTTVDDLIRALTSPHSEQSLFRGETAAIPQNSIPPTSPPKKIKRGWIIPVAGVFGMLAVGAVVLLGYMFLHGQTQAIPVHTLAPTSTPLVIAKAAGNKKPSSKQTAPLKTTAAAEPPSSSAPTPTVLTPSPAASANMGGGGVIAFSSNRGDGATHQIWTMRLTLQDNGSITPTQFVQLTTGEGDKTQPVWSPDGKQLLVVAPGGGEWGLDIWRIKADGSDPVDLTQRKGDDTDPDWAPDGSLIAFTNNGRADRIRQLYWMKADGSDQTRISYDLSETAPSWSPDMKTLAFIFSGQNMLVLWMRQAVQDFKTPMPFDRYNLIGRLGSVADPAWSPDGSRIAYTRLNLDQEQIFVVTVASGGAEIAGLTNTDKDREAAWSPDSRWILFTSQRDENNEVYIMSSAGTFQTNLTLNPAQDQQPAWQPLP